MKDILLLNLLFLGGTVYVSVMLAMFFIGLSQRWPVKSNERVLNFRKPKMLRLGAGMLGLLCLGSPWIIATGTHPSDLVPVESFFGPVCVGLSCLCAYITGPQDVSIEIDTRTCHAINGWMFHPRRQACPLTDTSSLRVWAGGSSWYVVLWIGGRKEPMFLLARPSRKSDAISVAQEIAEKLHLPLQETTLSELRKSS